MQMTLCFCIQAFKHGMSLRKITLHVTTFFIPWSWCYKAATLQVASSALQIRMFPGDTAADTRNDAEFY